MTVKIIYFSGTGNSLHLTRLISSKIPTAELLPAVTFLSQPSPSAKADAVGFVFPVHYMDVPELMQRIISKMDLTDVEYFFSAATCGGDSGNSHHTLNKILQAKGKKLHLGVEVQIGDNSIVYTTSPEVLAQRIARLEQISSELANRVIAREVDETPFQFKPGALVMKQVYRVALNQYYQIGRKCVLGQSCTQCGLCEKVCQVNNIHLKDGKVEFGDRCAACFACLNWCPQKAIRFGKIEMTEREQYHYPGIKAGELFQQKGG